MSAQSHPQMLDLGARRRLLGLTQAQVAAALGIHVRLVARWEKGKGAPSLRNASALSILYRVSIEEIAQAIGHYAWALTDGN